MIALLFTYMVLQGISKITIVLPKKGFKINIVPLSKMHGTERLSYSNTMIAIYHYIIYYYHCIDYHGALLKFFYVLTLRYVLVQFCPDSMYHLFLCLKRQCLFQPSIYILTCFVCNVVTF